MSAPLSAEIGEGGIGRLTLSRPEKRNALSIELRGAMGPRAE
jgi:enoyl-CoA hydratase/carnithine racemase